jgi:copper transport protein
MRGIGFVLVLLAALAPAAEAFAHASLIRSEPTDRAVVAQAPSTLVLTFNEPVSPLVVRLVRPTGEATELKDVVANDARLTIPLPEGLTVGTYLLSWRVISADGHPVGSVLAFSVGQPSVRPPTSQLDLDRRLRWAIWAAKLMLYVGLCVGIGGTFYAAWIAIEPLSLRTRTLIAAALTCGLLAAVMSVGLQGVDALGLPPSEVKELRAWASGFATSYGLSAVIAATALIIGLVMLQTSAKYGRLFSLLALLGAGAALAASGHASVAEPQLLTRPAVFAHVAAVAFWIGALVPLAAAMGLPPPRAAELMRFSRAIPIALVVMVVSGIMLAVIQVRPLDALWTTDYGLVLSAKLCAVLVLLALAAMNRYALTPRVVGSNGTAARRLAGLSVAEVLIALVVLGLVASWRFTPPPRALLAAAEAAVHLHIHADRAMADVTIEPERTGGRHITVMVLDGQFGPLAAKEVTLVLAKPAAGIEPLRLAAKHVDGATWRVDDVSIPVPGRWTVRVEILVSDFEKVMIEDHIDLPR